MLIEPVYYGANSTNPFYAVERGAKSSTYRSAADASEIQELVISHQIKPARTRSVVRLTDKRIAPDILRPDMNVPVSSSVYLVLDCPVVGYSNDAKLGLVRGLVGFLTRADGGWDATLARVFVGGES